MDSISLFFRYALSLTAWKRLQDTTWSLRANPSSGNLHPTEGYALLPSLEGIHNRPGVYHYASITPDVPSGRVKTLDEDAGYWTSQRRFNTLLLEIFAGLALVLAVMGIYGVLSNQVASRTREIGVRVAVGATPGAISRLVLRQSMVPLAIGLTIGLSGSVGVGRLMESLLFQVRSWDPPTLTAAVAAILRTSPAALWLPLRRATSVDCTVALREE